jgi:hypothetical protein
MKTQPLHPNFFIDCAYQSIFQFDLGPNNSLPEISPHLSGIISVKPESRKASGRPTNSPLSFSCSPILQYLNPDEG